MAIRIITREASVDEDGRAYLEFDGVVRQFAIGISRWHLRFHDNPSEDPDHLDHFGVHVVPLQVPDERQRIYFRVETSVSGVWPAIRREESRVWVSCIADVGRHERGEHDHEADPCVAFRSYLRPTMNDSPLGVVLPGARKLAEAFLCGARYYYGDAPSESHRRIYAAAHLRDDSIGFDAGVELGDASTGTGADLGLVAVASSEGRVFAKSVRLEGRALEHGSVIDFADVVGAGVRLDPHVVAFPKRFSIDPARYAGSVAEMTVGALCRVEGSRVWLDGPMLRMLAAGESGSGMGSHAYLELVVFVRTEPVVIIDHRDFVDLRLSGAPGQEYWEYRVADHWHEISRLSDVLEWQALAEGDHVQITVHNHCARPIQLTVNGEPTREVLLQDSYHATTVSAAAQKNISGWFVKDDANDRSEPLPDPVFEVIKQGGG